MDERYRPISGRAWHAVVTLNTYVGEWPDTDERTRPIIGAALGDVPSLCPRKTADW